MIPAAFRYQRASSVQEALQWLEESNGEAQLIAGGHSLLPMMKLRLSQPAALIDIGRIPGLDKIEVQGDRLVIGALTTHSRVAASEVVAQRLPALSEAAQAIGDLQVRNRGTIGGNLAHADPASDLPAVALALDAELVLASRQGNRSVAAADFFLGPLMTALDAGEMVTGVSFPLPAEGDGTVVGSAYEKFPHPASGYAVVGVAAALALDAGGRVAWVRVGVTGAGDTPYRARALEEALAGKQAGGETLQAAAAEAATDGSMTSDVFASAEYRAHLCRVYALRALERAVARAQGGPGGASRGRQG